LLTEQSSAGLTTYVYDESGNRIEKNAPAETTYYTWDEDSRLVAAEPPAGVTTLVYSADGLRVGKETPSESRKFIYDFRKLLQETDGADDPQRWYTFTTEEYGDLISQYDGADTLYHQYDGLGSTDALLDEWETATDRYAHRAFGLEAARSGTTDNPFTYVGRQSYYKDPELELYLLGARYYDPQAGRFLSHDPLGIQADDPNLYRYARNNPVNLADPSGEQPTAKDFIDLAWGLFDEQYGGGGEEGRDVVERLVRAMPEILETVREVGKIVQGTSDANVVGVAATLQRLLEQVAEPGKTVGHQVTVDVVGRMIDAMLQHVDSKHRDLLRAAIRAIVLDDYEGLEALLLQVFLEGLSDAVDRLDLWPLLDRLLGDELQIPVDLGSELQAATKTLIQNMTVGLLLGSWRQLDKKRRDEGSPWPGLAADLRHDLGAFLLPLVEVLALAHDFPQEDAKLLRQLVELVTGERPFSSEQATRLIERLSESEVVKQQLPGLGLILEDAQSVAELVQAAAALSQALNAEQQDWPTAVVAALDLAVKIVQTIGEHKELRDQVGLTEAGIATLVGDFAILRDLAQETVQLRQLDPGNEKQLSQGLERAGTILERVEGRIAAWVRALGIPERAANPGWEILGGPRQLRPAEHLREGIGRLRRAAENPNQDPLTALGLLSFLIVVAMTAKQMQRRPVLAYRSLNEDDKRALLAGKGITRTGRGGPEAQADLIGYNNQDTRYIAVTEDPTIIRDPDNMIVFRTAEVNYISMGQLLSDRQVIRRLGPRVRFVTEQQHAIVSREIPRRAMVRIIIDGKEVAP
jgi:RHS repeat-associated protein